MDTEGTIRAAVAAFSEGDDAEFDALLSDDLHYSINAQPGVGPFCAEVDCKPAFYEAMGRILAEWEIRDYRIIDLIVSGNRGAAQIAYTALRHSGEAQFEARLALFLTVEDGKLTEIHEYHDTAALGSGPTAVG